MRARVTGSARVRHFENDTHGDHAGLFTLWRTRKCQTPWCAGR